MTHPEHGAMHAYDKSEVERLRALGWSVEGEKPVAEQVPERKKPGPKPKAK